MLLEGLWSVRKLNYLYLVFYKHFKENFSDRNKDICRQASNAHRYIFLKLLTCWYIEQPQYGLLGTFVGAKYSYCRKYSFSSALIRKRQLLKQIVQYQETFSYWKKNIKNQLISGRTISRPTSDNTWNIQCTGRWMLVL